MRPVFPEMMSSPAAPFRASAPVARAGPRRSERAGARRHRRGRERELDLKGDVFAKIAIRVEAKGVETFVAEGVWGAAARVRIHGQSHDRCARAAAKQVEVADVDAGVFFCGRRIEMMRHGESSPKG